MGDLAVVEAVNLENSLSTLRLPGWLEHSVSNLEAGSREVIRPDGVKARMPWPTIRQSLAPNDQARAAIKKRLTELQNWQQRQNIDESMAQVAKLLISFPVQSAASGERAAEIRASAYIDALEDLPTWAIAGACREWLRGEAGQHNYNFAPAPPVLRTLAVNVKRRADVQIKKLSRLLDADVIPDPEQFTEEHRQTMIARLRELFANFGVRRAA